VLRYIKKSVRQHHEDFDLQPYIGGFFFLRFICPSIVVPSIIGIHEVPSQEAQRGLILVAKVLQNMSNSISFGEKESYMVELNEMIVAHTEIFSVFFDQLTDIEVSSYDIEMRRLCT